MVNTWEVNNSKLYTTWLPHGVDLELIVHEVLTQGNYVPIGDKPLMQQQITAVRQKYGINIAVVRMPENIRVTRTLFRDIADYISHHRHGTVLVFNGQAIASESDVYTRATLEASQVHVHLHQPETVVDDFARGLAAPHTNWNFIVSEIFLTALIIVMISRYKYIKSLLRFH